MLSHGIIFDAKYSKNRIVHMPLGIARNERGPANRKSLTIIERHYMRVGRQSINNEIKDVLNMIMKSL